MKNNQEFKKKKDNDYNDGRHKPKMPPTTKRTKQYYKSRFRYDEDDDYDYRTNIHKDSIDDYYDDEE
jgi:hypothetical protein